MSIQANIRRIAVDPANDYMTPFNKLTGGGLVFPRGRDVDLQFGYFENGLWVANPSHLATITAEIKPADRVSTSTVVANTSSPVSCQRGEWDGDTNQHFTISFPAAQTASLPAALETTLWFVVTALTTGGKALTLISGPCKAINDGGNYSATVPTPGDPSFVTTAQFYSAIAALSGGGIVSNGKRLNFVWDTVDQQWTQNTTDA